MDLLTINKRDATNDEDDGPKIDSNNRNERIEARRLRIKKKNDLNKKKLMGDTGSQDKEKKKEITKGRKQIQDSRTRLVKLEKDGLELVTNIRVAGDIREHARRTEEEENSRLRKERLEQEAKSANEKFEEIVKKWETAHSKDVPQELHEMLMDQKHLCDSMIDEKNKLINEFKQELHQKDEDYVKALKKFADEIDLLIERMKDQKFNMRKFYLEELLNIENAFISERNELLDKQRKEWDDKMDERKHKEVTFMQERFKRVERNENELNNLRIQYAEEFNEIKIRMETDAQILEQKVQLMKASHQLNQEKLEYNYQVLMKREEENAKLKNNQKRRTTKLQDILTNMKKKLVKQIKQFNDENLQLTEEYKRVTDMFNDLQQKSKHFLAVDLKKFHDIWKMNEDVCKKYAKNLLDADRIINEQQLGLQWICPDISFMENVGPLNSTNQQKTGKEFLTELLSVEDDEEEFEEVLDYDEQQSDYYQPGSKVSTNEAKNNQHIASSKQESTQSEANKSGKQKGKLSKESTQFREDSHNIILNLSKQTLRNIVMLICDEAGFLLEQKLVNLLHPLEKNEQSMVKLDSIFKSLGVETENDVKLLAQYFINHRQYKELIKNKTYTQKYSATSKSERGTGPAVSEQDDKFSISTRTVNTNTSHNEGKIVPTDSIHLIEQNEVVSALKTFVTIHHKSENQQNLAKFKLTDLDNRDDTCDQEYWEKYDNLIDPKKEKLWDAMLYALQKYYSILNRRTQLIDENKALANQNIELRMLLGQYMQSSINQELEIPPTKILQMEYSKTY